MARHPIPTDLPSRMMIGGQDCDAAGGERIETRDPATGRPFASVPAATVADVDRAVADSRAALRGPWRQVLPVERGRILNRIAALIRRDAARLAVIETLDSGKPLAECAVTSRPRRPISSTMPASPTSCRATPSRSGRTTSR